MRPRARLRTAPGGRPGAGRDARTLPFPAGRRFAGAGSPRHPLARQGLRFLRRRAAVLVALALWSLLETGQTFLGGYAMARAVDAGFLAGRPGVGLAWLAVGAAGILLGAVGTGRSYAGVAALAEPLRDALVRRVVHGALGKPASGAVARLTQQVEIARESFAGLVMVARSFVFTAAGALAGLVSLSSALLPVVGVPLVAGLAVFAVSLRPMATRQRAFLAAGEELADELHTTATGLRDVVACGAEDRAGQRSAERIAAEYRAARTLARWGTLRIAALAVGGRLPVVLLLITAPWLSARGVSAGDLVGALTYLTQSLSPALQALVHGFAGAGTRLTVVIDRLTAAPDPAPAPSPGQREARVAGRAPAVELRGVTFAYGEGARPVVDGLDLAVAAGEWLAVVGPSGVGKSTLAGLVAGTLPPHAGQVRVHGVAVAGGEPARQAALRVLIPQEAYVFTGTLRDNLGYLRPSTAPVTDTELRSAAGALGMAELVARLGGWDRELDPAALSAGERQLIALARAWLSPAPVALLDEATCHLDPAAEARVERAFAARTGGTLVVVAHRISSARRADRVLVLDGARAVDGTHEELLRRSALYRDLVGAWDDGSQPPGAMGDADGVDPVAAPGLAGDGGHVVAHRAVAQVQAARDLRDGRALGGQ
ncbi:ABC transporter ATP-binding protein [Streptomyces sp. NPDC001796]|uniref:ABC transporter ATP-binding protein n=1 Tax=Streptomyces sp. NPDC001796 TaxID=3364609 RepID=UPI003695CD91